MERQGQPEHQPPEGYLVKHTETGEVFDINDPLYEPVEGLLRPGVYRHHKSTPEALRYYEVEQVVQNTETEECLVIYYPLYETDEELAAARPLSIFTERVAVGKGMIPRFSYIGPRL